MASSFEHRSARRKFVYFGLILLLFTGSLLHRKLVIDVQANELLLSDVGRGKADLTDAALRLTLSGVRGVAVTSLWLAAIERQKRHEWNELELAVDSLTRLQPRFITPWLFQGWNLAFNVAVECDRPRDKYYYVTRGIALLCRGEEKNDPGQAVPPQPWPANPDLRFHVANTYLRKIGQSDENKTMRCLFELSCMSPAERDPDQFYMAGPQGKQLNLAKFKLFCENHPRLARRLRERLRGFEKPEAVVQFLADNKDIPARLEDRNNLEDDKRLAEFPILPPLVREAQAICPYPDWRSETLASSFEDFDVFTCVRAWHTYAQVPLPDPSAELDPSKFDRLKNRLPRLTPIIFRSYPARSQAFYAEELQKDGWFDDSGWAITGWFDTLVSTPAVIVGAGARYHSGEAWNRAYELYRNFGLRNGLLLEPEEEKKLADDVDRASSRSEAGQKLRAYEKGRELTNFDSFFQLTKVERTSEAVAARKAIFEVEQTGAADLNVINLYREKVLPQWLDLLLRNSDFRKISFVQEETYELQAKYFKELQQRDFRYRELISNVLKETAFSAVTWWPCWQLQGTVPLPRVEGAKSPKGWQRPFLKVLAEKKGIKVFPITNVEGLFDQLFLLEGPEAEAIKPVAVVLARHAVWPPPPLEPHVPDFALSRFVIWPPPPGSAGKTPEIGLGQQAVWPPERAFLPPAPVTMLAGVGSGMTWPTPTFLMLSSAEERRVLTYVASHGQPPTSQGWTPLVPPFARQQARNYIPWMGSRGESTGK